MTPVGVGLVGDRTDRGEDAAVVEVPLLDLVVEGDDDEIEEWDFHDGRVFASVGSVADESDPDRGHGWMCRLLDAGALGAALFARVRKPELEGLD